MGAITVIASLRCDTSLGGSLSVAAVLLSRRIAVALSRSMAPRTA